MVKVYGIKNCNTMKKAFDWLDKNKISYEFHDYKKLGIDEATIKEWLKKIPMEKLVNTKGATWRLLTDKEKLAINTTSQAISLMMSKTSVIKRPLVVLEKENYLLGFEEGEWNTSLK
jgi:arsenate reductase